MIGIKKFMICGLIFTMSFGTVGCGGGGNNSSSSVNLSGTKLEIVKDTAFANGFGAAWNYGTAFNGFPINKTNPNLANNLKKGYVKDYDDITGSYPYGDEYQSIKLIPKGEVWVDAMPTDEEDIYWCFEEGYHKNFTDKFGTFIPELHAHKLCVNHKVIENTADSLIFEQYNNYGIKPSDSSYDTQLVKRIESDRNGKIKTYYDTSKEIRNVAYKFDSDFAFDTWPHLYMQHNLREDLAISLFDTVEVNFDIKINKAQQVNAWPQGESDIEGQNPVTGGKAQSAIGLNGYFLLRYRADPIKVCMFVGHNIFATSEELKGEIITTEQYGNVFYRERINAASSTKAQPIAGGDWVHISFDLIRLVENALTALKSTSFSIKDSTLEDWDLSYFQIGFENMGNWIGEYELKDLSVVGTYL